MYVAVFSLSVHSVHLHHYEHSSTHQGHMAQSICPHIFSNTSTSHKNVLKKRSL